MVSEGDIFEFEFSFSQEDVNKFAEVSGDKNPLHLDAGFAATTPFKKPIIHGALANSIFSKVLGMDFPGGGTVYLKQESTFKRPMFVDTAYKATFEICKIFASRSQAVVKTEINDVETGKQTVTGEAMIMNKEKIS